MKCVHIVTHNYVLKKMFFFKTSYWLTKSASFELRIKTHLSIQYFILIWHTCNIPHNEGIHFLNKQEKMYCLLESIMKFSTLLFGVNGISPKIILITLKNEIFLGLFYLYASWYPSKEVQFFTQTKTCRIVPTQFLQKLNWSIVITFIFFR